MSETGAVEIERLRALLTEVDAHPTNDLLHRIEAALSVGPQDASEAPAAAGASTRVGPQNADDTRPELGVL